MIIARCVLQWVGSCLLAVVLLAGLLLPAAVGMGMAVQQVGQTFEGVSAGVVKGRVPLATTVTDAAGNPIAHIYEQYRLPAKPDEIAAAMTQAMVAIEDRRFYSHDGVDWQGTTRALLNNLLQNGSPLEGQGGSTITMQYVKNYRLYAKADTPAERDSVVADTLERKLEELQIAQRLEQRRSKEQLLTDYLNIVSKADQPPYYVLAGPPAGDGAARFQLTSALVGLRRQFMASYVSVSSAPQTYGDITVLRLPTDSQTLGPQQVQTRFRSSAEVSQELNLLQASETQLRFGNLLTLPTGDGTLLYVEPIYVERTNQEASFPQLNRVLVLYGDRVGYAASLNAALDEALGPDAAPPGGGAAQPPSSAPEPPPTPQPGAQASPELRQAVADITEALQRLQEARASGNFTEAGKALTALQDATRPFSAASEGDTATPSG